MSVSCVILGVVIFFFSGSTQFLSLSLGPLVIRFYLYIKLHMTKPNYLRFKTEHKVEA